MDNGGRVIFLDPSSKTKNYMCSVGWDEVDATVLCRSLNNTWIGNASVGEKISDFPIVPISYNCKGHEKNLLHCNITLEERKCMASKVAVAECCQGKYKTLKWVCLVIFMINVFILTMIKKC